MMKNLILFLTILFSPVMVLAQGDPTFGEVTGSESYMQKGRLYLGGTLKFNGESSKSEDANSSSTNYKLTSFSILPGMGYVISNNWTLELGMGYSFIKFKDYTTDNTGNELELNSKMGEFIISPRFGYYHQLTNRLYCTPFAYVDLGFGNRTEESYIFDGISSTEYKRSSFKVGIKMGLKYFVSNNWVISLTYGDLFYQNTTEKDKETPDHKSKMPTYGVVFDLTSIQLGLYYFIK